MRYAKIIKTVVAFSVVATLSACSSVQSNDQFVDGNVADGNSYQSLVNAILADDEVTKAEAEQAIEENIDCYEKQQLSGDYGYNLDLYHWIYWGSFGLAKSHPKYRIYSNSAEDIEAARKDDSLAKALTQCNTIFEPVEEWLYGHIDLDANERRLYEAKRQCLSNSLPEYAKRIDPEWSKLSGSEALSKLSWLGISTQFSENDMKLYDACNHYPSMVRKTFGGAE